ncbi:hypothetical protein [Streptomyces sp. NPDC050704]|uniref:hypothetical protein n=1 Tax=Streptomyces sp. NPDC050704 TaxID=3157219 RepID=UPI0034416BE4
MRRPAAGATERGPCARTLDDAHRCVADMPADLDVRYDLGDDHRLVGTLCPDMEWTLERREPTRTSSPR